MEKSLLVLSTGSKWKELIFQLDVRTADSLTETRWENRFRKKKCNYHKLIDLVIEKKYLYHEIIVISFLIFIYMLFKFLVHHTNNNTVNICQLS